MDDEQINIDRDDPAFTHHQDQTKAAACDAINGCEQFVLIVVNGREPQSFVSIDNVDKWNWVNSLSTVMKRIIKLN